MALAGNPNTGKTTLFNAVTGLRHHTGNWPGKTVARAESTLAINGHPYRIVDLPGTYSLLAASPEEEIARDFLFSAVPDVTVIVVDAGRMERNLNLVLQILEFTDRVVVCLNLMDEARRHGLTADPRQLARDLGIPVVATAARLGEGVPELTRVIDEVASGNLIPRPRHLEIEPPELRAALASLAEKIAAARPGLSNTRWLAMRLLGGETDIATAMRGSVPRPGGLSGDSAVESPPPETASIAGILQAADALRRRAGSRFNEHLVETIYAEAARLAGRCVTRSGERGLDFDPAIDRILTSRLWGFPTMALLLSLVMWITISGANIPSRWISALLLDTVHPALRDLTLAMEWPVWLRGVTVDGMYLATAWVVSVMLPPMAIFFPLFTLLEDLGYLPRVAFNLDGLFHRAGAHGKQALCMMMGFGCNAAGVVATRIIDSPRERLVAILTNNFSLCNGRWPTQFLVASLFIGGTLPAHLAGLVSAISVVGVAVLGVLLTFVVSWALSRTVLKGERSVFSLELPPYRPPRVWQTLYTSVVDRTLIVLWRAVVFALPAGAVIWLIGNVSVAGRTLAAHAIEFLQPAGHLLGLNGIILLTYLVAIPANEIVIPAVLMMTVLTTRCRCAQSWRRCPVRAGCVHGAAHAAAGRRLEPAHGGEPDAVQPAASPVQHDALHDLP